MNNKRKHNTIHQSGAKRQNLAVKSNKSKSQKRDGYVSQITPKAISRTRSDISTWKNALRAADNIESPRRGKLQNLYNDIELDAHLTSQLILRLSRSSSIPFILKKGDKEDQVSTDLLKDAAWKTQIDKAIILTALRGSTLIELTFENEELQVKTLPRNNIIPSQGLLLLSEDDTTGINYRNTREYGTWLLEIGDREDYGLLNKAVPHVLFSRFATSCWSELCEIYGIPPRYIKTDTTDAEMLNRAENMLRDMGSAAFFVIDNEEKFEFAKGADTNGDVYNNLISLCENKISLLITGAILGQDTKNGSYSKEESSSKLLKALIKADKKLLETTWNGTIIPALERIGVIPQGLRYVLPKEEDIELLWKMVCEILPFMDVDPKWIRDKFGIAVTGKKQLEKKNLSIDTDFFD